MNTISTIFTIPSRMRQRPAEACEQAIGRKLRSFDIDVVAPCDHKGLVAFLKADKLTELTSAQIRVFLVLRDNPKPEGFTEAYIAEWLDMAQNTVRSCLSVLKREGYALHSLVERRDDRGQPITAWVYDPTHMWADDEELFSEFARLP